ncbi:hypothetical protein [Geomonas subterranea]|uniref:Outer membrane lipoprotein-sorting protein n=1 Tax=Geomonas subterranea TaxID=2847989 RepID=A0ABX8LHW1_9BACT|nr:MULTISPECIES: hypothetical protein [Geomonas]QXE90327.1 hypothetical protein KP001_18235 [Geomonas subterranea]QXM07548.1 hypothetical protein KP002_11055 [Geomonas subterranea]
MKLAHAHLVTLITIIATALLAASPLTATAGERSGTAGKSAYKAAATEQTERMELKIGWVTVANDGSLHVDFTVRDGNGKGVTGLTRDDIAAVSFGRMGYEDEVGLRTVVGQPNKIWLSYLEKRREGQGVERNRGVVALGTKDRLTEEGDGSYSLEVKRPARLLTRFSYEPAAETGVLLRIKRDDGGEGKDSYFWRPALAKRIETPKMLARAEGSRPLSTRPRAWN